MMLAKKKSNESCDHSRHMNCREPKENNITKCSFSRKDTLRTLPRRVREAFQTETSTYYERYVLHDFRCPAQRRYMQWSRRRRRRRTTTTTTTQAKHPHNGVQRSQVAANSTSNMFQRGQDFRLQEFQWSSSQHHLHQKRNTEFCIRATRSRQRDSVN